MKKEPTEKVIETSTIRLSADETRTIMRASIKGNCSNDWRCSSLVGMGIMRKVRSTPDESVDKKREELWNRISKAVEKRNRTALDSASSELGKLDRDKEAYVYVLTDIGKQIARGITVRLNGQYA
ncbi:MAG TPA: hypothetical protein VNL17_14720 [Verrucomicrobiae bacterium]|nr:hypothetical protein [Verrucomicrobiae bacterium]